MIAAAHRQKRYSNKKSNTPPKKKKNHWTWNGKTCWWFSSCPFEIASYTRRCFRGRLICCFAFQPFKTQHASTLKLQGIIWEKLETLQITVNHIPEAPCIEYLSTFGLKFKVLVGYRSITYGYVFMMCSCIKFKTFQYHQFVTDFTFWSFHKGKRHSAIVPNTLSWIASCWSMMGDMRWEHLKKTCKSRCSFCWEYGSLFIYSDLFWVIYMA